MTDTIPGFADALSRPDATAASLLAVIGDGVQALTGARLVTLSAIADDLSSERLYTNMPEVYPLSGRKPANVTAWHDQVMVRHETFVANDYDSLSQVMFDHETIRATGCESIVNMPVVVQGRVIGTINCLGPAGHFDAETLSRIEPARLPVALALLLRAAG
jgi:hypothetical protein